MHRSKYIPYNLFLYAFLCFVAGLISRESSMFCIVLSLILTAIGINKLKRKDKIIRIDKQGITTEEEGPIFWEQMKRCFYKSVPRSNNFPKYYLEIVLKNNEHINIELNDYSCNSKKMTAAINFYSGKKLYGRTDQDDKDELKGILITFAVIVVFLSLIMLLVANK